MANTLMLRRSHAPKLSFVTRFTARDGFAQGGGRQPERDRASGNRAGCWWEFDDGLEPCVRVELKGVPAIRILVLQMTDIVSQYTSR